MSALLKKPLEALVDAPETPASDLAEALTVRMASLTLSIGAAAGRGELLRALSAGSATQFLSAVVDVFAAHQPHDLRAVLRLKGRAELLKALEESGGLWRADEAQEQLRVGRAALQAWRRDRKVLALPLPDGSFGYPIAQFAPPDSDLQAPRPYPAIETVLQFVGDALTAEELFLLLATRQDALASPDGEWRSAFECIAVGEGALVLALLEHVLGGSDDGEPASVRQE